MSSVISYTYNTKELYRCNLMSGHYGLGSIIDSYRVKRRYTKASLARAVNIHRSMITRIINGQRGISKELYDQLCLVLKIETVSKKRKRNKTNDSTDSTNHK